MEKIVGILSDLEAEELQVTIMAECRQVDLNGAMAIAVGGRSRHPRR